MADDKPIIVIKKKGGHGGHHGGAWKVAYADFVTAMMAFFMVMWLVNSAETKTKTAIASYFRRPGLFESGSGTPLLIGGAGMLTDAYAPPKPKDDRAVGSGAEGKMEVEQGKEDRNMGPHVDKKTDKKVDAKGIIKNPEDEKGIKIERPDEGGAIDKALSAADKANEKYKSKQDQKAELDMLSKALKEKISEIPEYRELLGLIEIRVEADGLTIEIMDTDKTSMFRSGSAQIQPKSVEAFKQVANLLKPLPNKIDIMGHTDAKPFSSRGGMSNWELSADRANAARRVLEQQGITSDRITSVMGRADRDLRLPEDPFNATNRRISLKVKFELDKLKGTPEEIGAMDRFKEFFPDTFNAPPPPEPTAVPTAPPVLQEYGPFPEGYVPPTASVATPLAVASAVQTPAKTPAKDSNDSYKPRVAITGAERKDLVELPEEAPVETGNSNSSGQKIFKDNPVVGPINPFFNQ